MKKIFIAIVALAAAAACSNSEIVSLNQEAIAFDNAFVNNSTRSVVDPSMTNENLTGAFAVYATVADAADSADANTAYLFNNEEVTGSGTTVNGNASWSYTNTQYWIDGAHYKFAAVFPYECAVDNAYDKATETTSLSFTNDGITDLLYDTAIATGEATGNAPVAFSFRHTLSKVRFSFLNNYNGDGVTIAVKDIKIHNAYKTGDVALTATTTTWSNQANSLELEFGNANTTKENTAAAAFAKGTEVESHNEFLLIPANYTAENKLSISFSYDVLVNGTVIKNFPQTPAVTVNLEPGHAYDFKATITNGEPIVFTVTEIDEWDTTNENQTM